MTIGINDRKITYAGNGATTVFAYDFPILVNTEVRVRVKSALGLYSTMVLTTNYTVSGVGESGGGNITFVVAPAAGTRIILEGNTPTTQAIDYVENDPFPAETHEAALDKLTKKSQELEAKLNTALLVGPDIAGGVINNIAGWGASKVLTVDAAGESISFATIDDGSGVITNLGGANGLIAQTGTTTYVSRTLTGSAEVAITDGDGVAGNPTLSVVDGSIALTKLASTTASRALVSSAAGVVAPSAVTATELGHLTGVTSAIQTQINTNATAIATKLNSSAVSAAALTVLDDATVAAMVDTLGGAATTGTGGLARATSPVFVTPALGVPASGVLTNCTGLPIASGISGLAAGVGTFLATPTSVNLAAALTTKTGTGNNVFADNPTLTTPILGTPASGTLTNCTGYPVPTATQAEMETATSTAVYVTPGRQQFHPGMLKAWVKFNGQGVVAISASHNVTSITDNGVGDYTINFTTSMSSANYGAIVVPMDTTFSGMPSGNGGSYSTGSHRFMIVKRSDGTAFDSDVIHAMYAGDQ